MRIVEYNCKLLDKKKYFVEHKYKMLNINMQVVEFCNIWLTIIFWVLFHGFLLRHMVPFARLSLSLAESKLLKSCTEAVKPAEDIPPTAALIIDGMVILQSMKEIPATFKELVAAVFDSVSKEVRL